MDVCNGSDMPENTSWTFKERQLMDYCNIQCNNGMQNLQDSISYRMRESTLGIFLYHLNKAQEKCITVQQDKLERALFDIDKRLVNLITLERQNDLCENLFTLIQKMLKDNPSGVITAKDTLQKLKFLRLTGSKVTTMDDSLQRLFKLQALVLAGNCLSKVPGHYLPRQLLLLELCCNKLQDLSYLLEDCPPHLLYLGLSRNYLTQVDTRLSHLVQSLYHLDLAHNDIEELPAVASVCSELSNLSSLLLIGNPCSMTENYLHFISYKMPKLIFLDGIIIKKISEDFDIINGNYLTGTLQMTLYRIMSLPQPIPEKINKKKIIHSFRIEVSCQLLKPYIPVRDEFFTEDTLFEKENVDEKFPKLHAGLKQKEKSTNTNGDISQSKKSKGGKPKEVDNKERMKSQPKKISAEIEDTNENKEYEAMLKTDNSNSQLILVSDRKPWGKIMEFSDPTIEVTNCDLFTLRNVFRSNLTIRLVYFKTLPPDVKKRKNSKQSKKQNKERKSLGENNENIEKQTKEILVSKTTLAKLVLPLQDVLWNMKSLDFTWCKSNPLKTEISSPLKELQYVTKKKKKEPKRQNEKANENTQELQTPSELTLHIGVGLKRMQSNKTSINETTDDQETIPVLTLNKIEERTNKCLMFEE